MPLSEEDRALVARDTALPGLALALDAEAVAARLGTGPLRAGYLRYKPGQSCTVQFDDGGEGITFRAVTPERFAIYRDRPEWREPGSPLRFLDEACAVALPSRLDREVKGARRLLDPERRQVALAALLGPADRGYGVRVLRMKPGRRLVLRADRDGAPVALVKAVTRAGYPRLVAGARRAAAPGPGRGPDLLAQDATRFVLAQGWIAGETAAPGRTAPADFFRIGETLAALHALPAPPGDTPPHPAFEALAALCDVLPALARPAEALTAEIRTGLAGLPADRSFCHGDFSADQVVLADHGVRLIDWDRAGPGDPLTDIASFLARLDMDRLEGRLAPETAAQVAAAFLAGYRRAGGALPGPALAIHHAAALAALAIEPFRSRHPDWAALTGRLLDRARARLAPFGLLSRALDRDGMEVALSTLWRQRIRLDPPELLRDRPGRRALIAYRGDAAGTPFEVYGKLQIRRPDRRTPELHDRLRAAGLSGAVAVTEVTGRLPERHLWLQRKAEGICLAGLLAPEGPVPPFHVAGRALARLHGAGVRATRRWSMQDEVGVLHKALSDAAEVRPDLAARLAAVAPVLAAAALSLPPVASACIHRDFYPDQLLVSHDRVWILDLDLHADGDPAIDIANFLAHLDEHGLRHHGAADALAPQARTFLAGYAEERQVPPEARIAVHRRLSLARHVWIALRVPGRAQAAEAVLSEVERVLATGPAASVAG